MPGNASRGESGAKSDTTPAVEQAKLVGSMLLNLVVPRDVQAELRTPGLFLELGVDEPLLEYPWELMHDDDEFLCLKQYVGRFVNVTKPGIPPRQQPETLAPGPLSVLIISVPQPQPRPPNLTYDSLPGAEAETTAIVECLTPFGASIKVSLLKGPRATFDNVFQAIRGGRYHIVHFNGHAFFKNDRPDLSSLVLFDRDMSAAQVYAFFGTRPPLFFFMNACETAVTQSTSAEWKDQYNIFGLARALLETGAYLVGVRSKVGDAAAAAFAKSFYLALLDGQPLGRVMQEARIGCRKASTADDLSWASYLFYGDPRLCFTSL
ncbi:MAG TPA: CHAT domain-containing protein [Thermoanaerobaculia bacterium]|nr:CHAT domain-containing protein [Thermoanaerobaculia bacterium]